MKTHLAGASVAALILAIAAPAFAQTTEQTTTVVTKRGNGGTAAGAATGAATGAVVGGPVGAVVGGAVGAVAGHTADPPKEVRTYIQTQTVDPVQYDGPIVVGTVLPTTVVEYDVPRYDRYRWTYINGQRLLIDRRTNKIISVINDD